MINLTGNLLLSWCFDMEKNTEIHIRISEYDKERIRAKMESAGVKNLSAYIMKMAIDGYIIVLDLSDVKEVVRLMRINSNNLNQYAKKANETGSVYQQDIQQLKNQQEEIWIAVKDILARLAAIQ